MRRILQLLGLVLVLAALSAALSPFWLGFVLPRVAAHFGASAATYSRIGYSRFALTDVIVRRRTVTVSVSRIEADTPWLWAVRHLMRKDRLISAGNWKVDVHTSHGGSKKSDDVGWVSLQGELIKIANGLDRWLAAATIGPGVVRWSTGEIALDEAHWEKRSVVLKHVAWSKYVADGVVSFSNDNRHIQVNLSDLAHVFDLTADTAAADVQGMLSAWDQRAPFNLHFPSTGWTPEKGSITAENWKIAGKNIGLVEYSTVLAAFRATWTEPNLSIDLRSTGESTEETKAPKISVVVQANADADSYHVTRFDVNIPGASAHLDQSFTAAIRGGDSSAPSHFSFDGNLRELPWIKGEGIFSGKVDVKTSGRSNPIFDFSAQGKNLVYGGWNATSFECSGILTWPRLEVHSLTIKAEGATELKSGFSLDFRGRKIEKGRIEGQIASAIVRKWLPEKVDFSFAKIVVEASGPFENPIHHGSAEIDNLVYRDLTHVAASGWWKGQGREIAESEFGIHNGTTEVVAKVGFAGSSAEIRKLVWRQEGLERLALLSPATLDFQPTLQLRNFTLTGPAGKLSVSGDWSEHGNLHLAAEGIESAWWKDFVPHLPFDWEVNSLVLDSTWTGGPAQISVQGHFSAKLADRPRVAIQLAAHSEAGGIRLERLSANEEGEDFAFITGDLPVRVFAAPRPRLEFEQSAPFKLVGKIDPQAREWTELAERTGLTLRQPNLAVELDGSAEHPRGKLTLSVDEIKLKEKAGARKWPTMEEVKAEITATGDRLTLTQASLRVDGQTLFFGASLPLDSKTWTRLREKPVETLREEAEVTFRAEHTQLASFAPLVSTQLLPQGTFDADLTLSARGEWKGFLRLEGISTRPFSALGPLRDMRADFVFSGRELKLNQASAGIGGETIRAEGRVEYPVAGKPRFDLSVTGDNLPFVREAGLLIRGNVRLKVGNENGRSTIPTISGDVELRDGIFVSDVRSLIPRGGTASAARRPPYFSVSAAPFDHWHLDVNLHGERFLRARTTLVNGVASMKFHLDGTLGEPRALGELRLNDGQVLLPFARFDLQDATVRLTEEKPYDPQLGVFGSSRRYGYDLRMEVTGSAERPNLVFTSNPPLTSEQVLLLVMAGETPKDEVTYSNSQRFARIGTFFGQSLLGSLSGGRGEDRLTISSGEQVSVQGRETYDVEYELGDRWILVGEYDEFDEFNAGLKWRVLPKQKYNSP